jgi:hypothetical protein
MWASRKRPLPTTIASGLSTICACRAVGNDSGMRHVDKGMTEQQVLALVGPPTVTGKPSAICARNRNSVREMLYGTKWVWFGGLFEGPFVESAYVCLDASAKVVETGTID